MVHFYDSVVHQIEEYIKDAKDAQDCADICNDLMQIQGEMAHVEHSGDCRGAWQLDQKLRQKYPGIAAMLSLANTLSAPTAQSERQYSDQSAAVEHLKQDYFGILYDTAIKKGLIRSVKEFIKSVS